MSKKQIKTACLLSLSVMGLLFLAFAFSQWSLNPKQWGDVSRVFCSLFSLVGIFISFGSQAN